MLMENEANNTPPLTSPIAPAPVGGEHHDAAQQTKLMSILAYIGPLVIVSYIVAHTDPVVKFHIKQGLVLLVIEVALQVFGMLLFFLYPLIALINLGILVLAIIGIINAVHGKQQDLPLVGQYAKYFNF